MNTNFTQAVRSEAIALRRPFCTFLFISASCAGVAAYANTPQARELSDLSLEQLSNIVVTSVSRREQSLGSAAASIYVISGEDIRRSGKTSLPEVLRLAPNLQVARTDANQYAISARGFNNPITNRLLVLIDGRTVYSPLYSGVFWDVQDVMLKDVERIEVISGPGATLWGANAVNGVINVITRRASDTQGTLVALGSGSQKREAVARYGGGFGDDGYFRVYGKTLNRDHSERADGRAFADASERTQAGFRADWNDARFTVQGDAYKTNIDQPIDGSRNLAGANLLGRWSEERDDGSSWRVQTYVDHAERDQPGAFNKTLNVFDLEFQRGLRPAGTHWLLWGGGYRYADDNLDDQNIAAFAFIPEDKRLHWYHLFVQDEWTLRPDLSLTLGIKGEHNDYTGVEWLPNARVAWAFAQDQLLWGEVSRAVRAPSRLDREFFIPGTPPYTVAGGPNFQSEVSNVVEVGYRLQPLTPFTFSITAFHHQHDRLRSIELRPGGGFLANNTEGSTSGIETWGSYRVTRNWRLEAGWVELRQNLRSETGSTSPPASAGLGNDPRRWLTFRSALDITPSYEFDLIARYVGELPNPAVPAYTAVDARFGWRILKELELSLELQNLFDPVHPEWNTAANDPVEFQRAVFLELIWRS